METVVKQPSSIVISYHEIISNYNLIYLNEISHFVKMSEKVVAPYEKLSKINAHSAPGGNRTGSQRWKARDLGRIQPGTTDRLGIGVRPAHLDRHSILIQVSEKEAFGLNT